jgi:hypothetical protein
MSKTIDIRSLLIGFLLATSVMLFMGATTDNENGRYQAFSSEGKIHMIDTRNGTLHWFNKFSIKKDGPFGWFVWGASKSITDNFK